MKRGRPLKASKKDPHMLGAQKYEQMPLDTYFTPEWCVHALFDFYRPPKNSLIWEPFVGIGNIARILQANDNKVICSDIKDYGHPMTIKMDFTNPNIKEFGEMLAKDISNFEKNSPDFIITNPPYTKLQKHVEKMLELACSYKAGLALLMRNEFDCGKTRSHIFQDCDSYIGKIILTTRPRWFSEEKDRASPRHNFSWYLWDYTDNLCKENLCSNNKMLAYSYKGEGYTGDGDGKSQLVWNDS